MSLTLEELEAVIRNRICRACTDRTVDGKCGFEEPDEYALFRLFPEVARAIQATNSDHIVDYIDRSARTSARCAASARQTARARHATKCAAPWMPTCS
jgi:hypothetical protein